MSDTKTNLEEVKAALGEIATLARTIADNATAFDDRLTDSLVELVRGSAIVLDAADAERRSSRARTLEAASEMAAKAAQSITSSEAA